MSKHAFWTVLIALCFKVQLLLANEPFAPKVIENAKKSVVTIQANSSFAAYETIGRWCGTGCIVDKKKGLILTNQHVIGTAVVGSYEVIFFNGIQKQAVPIYYDPWLDYGFLKVDPDAIPEEATSTRFSKANPMVDQPIFMIGNNEGFGFSLHTGVVAGLYGVEGKMPQQSIKLSLNSKGGSSGSPIFNTKGEAIGLNYAGNQTFGFALHPEYMRYALASIRQGQCPMRKHIGILTQTASIGDLVQYNGLPAATQQQYIKNFPSGSNNAIQVSTVLHKSPAAGLIFPGDLIWAIDGRQIGPNLVHLDMAMNQTQKEQVVLTVFRNGLWHNVAVKLYNLEDHKISKMVHFGGVMFFEIDDYCSQLTGMAAKTLAAIIAPNSIFSRVKVDKIKIVGLNEQPVTNLEELMAVIPLLMAKKYFTIDYVSLSSFCGFNQVKHVAHDAFKANVEYSTTIPGPRLFLFHTTTKRWASKKLSAG